MSDETPVIAALQMDRGLPLGNSEDADQRRALHVKVKNKFNESIPVYDAAPGDPVFLDQPGVPITPGAEQLLITAVVPAGKQRQLARLVLVCRQEGAFSVLANGAKIAGGRTAAADPNAGFVWTPRRPLAAGTTIEVKFEARAGAPATATVEAYLQAADVAI